MAPPLSAWVVQSPSCAIRRARISPRSLRSGGESTSDIDVAKVINVYEQTRIAALERIGELLDRHPRRVPLLRVVLDARRE